MAYEKHWANNENLNNTELAKLDKDGLKILEDIPEYAKNGFDSIPKDQWDLFKWAGLYLQKPKEAGYFMMRVNVPSGILTRPQVEALAGIARDYGRDVIDITTRQAIQFHWLTIEQIPDIFDRLEAVGLSSTGACGDITRNIVGNPISGLDPNELFDTTDIVKAVYDFFQRNEDFSNLPRKYKVSISANLGNASNAEINCLSFTPATKEMEGELKKGFHVKVGGGLSSRPFLAQTLDAFVLPEQTLDVAIAVTTIFRDHGYRDKRHHARLKFLVADWGKEKFLEKLVELVGPLPSQGDEPEDGWNAGYFYGIHDQKQDGLKFLGFNVPIGRMHTDELFELARVSGKYGNGEIRTCNSQNLIIPNIPEENVEALLLEPIFERITIKPNSFIGHAVTCTGNEYCNLALVETKERMRAVAEALDKRIELDVPVRMHMVGCPNSCGQRQIADIGLQGVLMRNADKEMVEAYELYVGGTLHDGGKFNEKLKGRVPAENLTDVLEQLLSHFKSKKNQHETYFDFVNRMGLSTIQTAYDHILEQVG
ncbi:MAG: nitrite/sulfite reductase [Defluviitaleaceae bacterium]|nr:nitrite/sulfite reductase [Defluviitaleaceae bacterium]